MCAKPSIRHAVALDPGDNSIQGLEEEEEESSVSTGSPDASGSDFTMASQASLDVSRFIASKEYVALVTNPSDEFEPTTCSSPGEKSFQGVYTIKAPPPLRESHLTTESGSPVSSNASLDRPEDVLASSTASTATLVDEHVQEPGKVHFKEEVDFVQPVVIAVETGLTATSMPTATSLEQGIRLATPKQPQHNFRVYTGSSFKTPLAQGSAFKTPVALRTLTTPSTVQGGSTIRRWESCSRQYVRELQDDYFKRASSGTTRSLASKA